MSQPERISAHTFDGLLESVSRFEKENSALHRELAQVRVLLRQWTARAKATDRDYAELEEVVERVHGGESILCVHEDCTEFRGDNPFDLCPGHAGDFDCAGDEAIDRAGERVR